MSQLPHEPYLSDAFVSRYADRKPPFAGAGLGEFVYTRTYSRWLPDKGRREYWHETVRRTVEESISLYSGPASRATLSDEAEHLYDAVWSLRMFPSGRSLWIAGTESSQKFPSSQYNCSFAVMDDLEKICDLFLLLMVGTGFGFRVLPGDVAKLPDFRTDLEVEHAEYTPVEKSQRREHTWVGIDQDTSTMTVLVGDSKEGWVSALRTLLDTLRSDSIQPKVRRLVLNYNSVRPQGERLDTFGGRASGPEALRQILTKVAKFVRASGGQLHTVDVLDICNAIGEGVVCGGVRRTSQISLGSPGDRNFVKAKVDFYNDPALRHRSMSNNTVMYDHRPDLPEFAAQMELVKENGEPGILNAEAARKRRPWFEGVNPCSEVLCSDRGMCNLSTVNVKAHIVDGYLDHTALMHSVRLATRVGMRLTNVDMSLPEWDAVQKRDRLIGVSMTGWMDAIESFDGDEIVYRFDGGVSLGESPENLLRTMRREVDEEADEYAYEMRIPRPLLTTTVKPEGSLSQLPSVSSGLHRPWAPYFVRRVRISSADPLARTMLYMNYSVYPEVGQWDSGESDPWKAVEKFDSLDPAGKQGALSQASTWVVEFPQKSEAKMTSQDEPAVDQLSRYFAFQRHYTSHNTSISVYVGDDEWDAVTRMVWDNWDDFVGISFLPKQQTAYALAPYEEISEAEYLRRVSNAAPFDRAFLDAVEKSEWEEEIIGDECATGACPIR